MPLPPLKGLNGDTIVSVKGTYTANFASLIASMGGPPGSLNVFSEVNHLPSLVALLSLSCGLALQFQGLRMHCLLSSQLPVHQCPLSRQLLGRRV
jgi:hypothetical protein